MSQFQGRDHYIFGDFIGAAFYHQDGFAGARQAQVEIGFFNFVESGIDDELTIDAANAYRTDWAIPGNIRNHYGGGGGIDGQDVQRVDAIRREREHHHLHFVAHAVREKRAQRAVGQTRGKDGVGGGAAFAAEERAGDFAASIQPFFVFNRQGEEVNTFAYTAHGGGRENDRIFQGDGDSPASLGGQLAGFKCNTTRPNLG